MGKGFFTELEVSSDAPVAPTTKDSIRFGDVVAEVVGLEAGVGFLLYVDRGRMTALEGYTFEEAWPERIEVHSMGYAKEPCDFSSLV